MATTKEVLDVARKELGVKESPANSNNVKYNTWFYDESVSGSAYPWCMAFVQWCFARADMRLPCVTASCSELLNWYKRNHPDQVKTSAPKAGDIVIYTFGHTGIVESASGNSITSIEGNTSPGTSGSQSNGGMVCRRTRQTYTVKAYIRPNYDKEVKPMDNTPSPAHKEAVEWAKKNGILTGDKSGDLMLSQTLTRQQMCSMLYRFAKKIGKA